MSIAASARPETLVGKFAGPRPGDPSTVSFWRSLEFFSYYRLVIAGVLLGTIVFSSGAFHFGLQDSRLFFWASLGYLAVAVAGLAILTQWQNAFNLQLTMQVVADIFFLTLLMYASGGTQSGIGMLLLVVLAGAGLVGQGRLVLFYAALATLALLLEQSYRVLLLQGEAGDFVRTGLTSIGFFGSAIAARLLAKRVVANEELARLRGIELADQMRINERVIRDMQDGVLVVDAAGELRQFNPPAAQMLGLPMVLPTMLAASAPVLAKEFLARSKLGTESEMVLHVPQTGRALRARFLPPGEGGAALIFLQDIGRLQQQAQQVKLAALGRLTANMAHEIRNPLASISHAAELLPDERSGKGVERLVRIIGDNTQRLNRLVAEVMELGQRDRSSPEQIDIREFLQQVKDEFVLRDASNANRIRLDLPPGVCICFDRGHLYRVVANLIDNALRYASMADGAVRIYGNNDAGGQAQLHLVDDGPGIGEAERNQVFEPFFTTRASGTGLGLYIARELCEANNARLALLNGAPGAHFCISCSVTCQNPNHVQTAS
jgi:two-component system sensor histidine kinase PilS (NtrC family)